MSYEPTLVIKKSDLDLHSDKFERFWEWDNDVDLKRVMEYLRNVHKSRSVVKIDNIELVLCSPEYSTFNRLVREKLTEWGVQFGKSN